MEEAQALQGRLFHDLEAIQSEDLGRSKRDDCGLEAIQAKIWKK